MSYRDRLSAEDQQQLELDDSTLEEYAAAFSMFDKNNDGTISADELGVVVRSLGGNPTDAEIDEMITMADENKSGVVEFNEFCKMIKAKGKSTEEEKHELCEAFTKFDKDGSGFIEANELRTVLLQLSMPPEDVDAMIQVADKDNNGKLDIKEFTEILSSK